MGLPLWKKHKGRLLITTKRTKKYDKKRPQDKTHNKQDKELMKDTRTRQEIQDKALFGFGDYDTRITASGLGPEGKEPQL
jgi:hypothetical protein